VLFEKASIKRQLSFLNLSKVNYVLIFSTKTLEKSETNSIVQYVGDLIEGKSAFCFFFLLFLTSSYLDMFS
jgi:hypothetical protein